MVGFIYHATNTELIASLTDESLHKGDGHYKKLEKIVLTAALTAGITAPYAVLSQSASAATVQQSFTSEDQAYRNAVGSYFTQRFEKQAFEDYVKDESDKVVRQGNEAKIADAYNRLVLGERNYQTYKNLYLAELNKLKKSYTPYKTQSSAKSSVTKQAYTQAERN
ncbi:hypothetical protein PP175_01470 [Aneurinibacillus sp. Ricciae_BoGa-3]|uniref:hypothetical protein n=1 Tax=Aneurinibacillus sp. Ricciae_BoGa-3 TaxID=3022697 RepID=UPI002341C9DC|nr:hypothetical protein [Aneurinibacillus sp. Ricciae_BoGa-3]WCK54736.1 hypothetical protein PP175_01470 [Aneurinibacillus sp. Ricciae_BoGa-3]